VERIADDILMIDGGRTVLDMPLEQIRENYRRVTLGFDRAAPVLDRNLLGVEKMRVEGRQISVLASSNANGIAEAGRALQAVSVDVASVSLREIFLESVQGDGKGAARETDHVLV
jgi:ABC-type uncharacterized transport system ATPase subunit